MLLRYFCPIDLSPTGIVALAHLEALRTVTKHPIRIIGAVGGTVFDEHSAKQWRRHRDLIGTPLEEEFVNIVCTPPERWDGLYTAKVFQGTRPGLDRMSGCVKNILILAQVPPKDRLAALAKYEVVLNLATVQAMEAIPERAADLCRSVGVSALAAAVA